METLDDLRAQGTANNTGCVVLAELGSASQSGAKTRLQKSPRYRPITAGFAVAFRIASRRFANSLAFSG